MGMTTNEIYFDVSDRWQEYGLGLAERAVGWHLADMRTRLANIAANYNEPTPDVSSDMLWVLAQAWALLRWRGDLPIDYPSWYYEPGDATPTTTVAPLPREEELDSYPLAITGIQYHILRSQDYAMVAATYVDILTPEWLSDTVNMWTDTSTETARYLFEICKQYLLRHGIADS